MLKNVKNEGGAGSVTKVLQQKDFVFLFAENVDEPSFVTDLLSLKSKWK